MSRKLTKKQFDYAASLIAVGMSRDYIANEIGVKPRTVDTIRLARNWARYLRQKKAKAATIAEAKKQRRSVNHNTGLTSYLAPGASYYSPDTVSAHILNESYLESTSRFEQVLAAIQEDDDRSVGRVYVVIVIGVFILFAVTSISMTGKFFGWWG